MNLCVDIDGTVTDPLYWLDRANAYFGMAVRPEHVNEYAIHRVMNVPETAYREFYNTYGALVHKEAAPLPGAREILTMLHSQQHAIQLAGAGFNVALIDCSYNQGRLPAHVLRVHHWKEILDLAYRRTAGSRNPLSA